MKGITLYFCNDNDVSKVVRISHNIHSCSEPENSLGNKVVCGGLRIEVFFEPFDGNAEPHGVIEFSVNRFLYNRYDWNRDEFIHGIKKTVSRGFSDAVTGSVLDYLKGDNIPHELSEVS